MTRIQILPLPSVVVGDSLEEPFALIVDQHTAASDDLTPWEQFRADCGARAVLVTPETVEVVDRYAETPLPDGQDQGEDGATREPNGVARLAEPWPAAPCPDWIREVEHPAHEWDAPVGGRSFCLGWPTAAALTLEADRPDPEVARLAANWPKLAKRDARGGDVTTLQDDWRFSRFPNHAGRLADAVLAALDEQGLEITRRGDVASEVTALVTDGHGEISIYGRRHKILSWSTEFTEFWGSPAGSHVITLHTAPPDTPRTHPGGGE